MQSNDAVQPQSITIPIIMRDCAFGFNRVDPATLTARNLHVIKKCDACGREFAYQKYTDKVFRCCCEKCTDDWKRYSNVGFQRERLYYFRVKVHEKFKEEINPSNYTPLELDIIEVLQRGPATREDLVKAIYGVDYLPSGIVMKRTTIYDGLKKLINKEKIRKYPNYHEGQVRGRPKTMFALQRRITTIKDFPCPSCQNNKYHVDEANKVVECVFCSAEWYLDGNGKPMKTVK
jgi:hypothetical protein